jgi:hypothetical protein
MKHLGGKDALNGFKRFFKGNMSDEMHTKLGQLDYAANRKFVTDFEREYKRIPTIFTDHADACVGECKMPK